MLRAVSILVLTLLTTASSVRAEELTPTQLPRNVRPAHYDVSIVPDAANLAFTGRVEITIDVLEPTATITLHAADITFSSATLRTPGGQKPFAPAVITVDEANQTAALRFTPKVPVGRFVLTIDYAGRITQQAYGLFALDYETAGVDRRALYTQFENSDARRMVPSWDEPSHKATFTLHATVPRGQMAVSNMPVEKTTDLGGGRVRVDFKVTPRMSTYLLFFAMGEFDRITEMVDGVEIGVVTRKGASDQARFALESSKNVLREYNKYFGIPYPLPKLDNVAAPGSSQFFGAMENWGAILTFESAILLDPKISTQADKQEAFRVAAHEISHQWFGNLVTMAWWDDLWLNEGFASWMEGRTTEWLHPEWNSALEAVGGREVALRRDSSPTTHPVIQKIETVEQASQAFDTITYQKGEAVIRMLEGYIGNDAWREGVRRYLDAHRYGNTVSNDLWTEIEAAAKRPLKDIADDFTLQPGVPLIAVKDARCDNGRTRVTLTQGELVKDSSRSRDRTWRTPVFVKTVGAKEKALTVVRSGRADLILPGCDPVIVNAGQGGYFRTLYSPAAFARVAESFAHVDPVDQLGLLHDSWALGLSGLQPSSDFFDLVVSTPIEADPQVWGQIATALASLNALYQGRGEAGRRYRAFAVARLEPVLARIGWTEKADEPSPARILRTDLIEALGDLGDAKIVEEARRRFRSKDEDAMPASIRRSILGVVARHADAATWERLHEAAKSEGTPLVKDQYYRLLASAEDPALARRALDLALTPEPGSTNASAIISTVSGLHPDLAFDFAIANLKAVDEKVDASSRTRYYAGLASGSTDRAMISKLKDYAKKHLAEGSRREAETAIASVESRIHLIDECLPAIDAWLTKSDARPLGRTGIRD